MFHIFFVSFDCTHRAHTLRRQKWLRVSNYQKKNIPTNTRILWWSVTDIDIARLAVNDFFEGWHGGKLIVHTHRHTHDTLVVKRLLYHIFMYYILYFSIIIVVWEWLVASALSWVFIVVMVWKSINHMVRIFGIY